jgi:poly-beta-1,6-N-acetyl-D-glucosamine synthase
MSLPGLEYALVTPARDEAANLAVLGPTVLAQTEPPAAWVIVDDGSRDGTAEVAAALARRVPWISVVHTGRRTGQVAEGRREGRALRSFHEGVDALPRAVDVVVKLDADVTLPEDYFAVLTEAFRADDGLGMASGSRCELEGSRWQRRHLTGTAVEAQVRAYRWACWHGLQPLEARMGWDGIDEARAVLAGWRTRVIDGLEFRHNRRMGRRDGSRVRARAAEGTAAHFMGYRPSYLVLRALWQARREPAALAMLWGYATAVGRRRSRCQDAAVRAYFRDQQAGRRLATRMREARGTRAGP